MAISLTGYSGITVGENSVQSPSNPGSPLTISGTALIVALSAAPVTAPTGRVAINPGDVYRAAVLVQPITTARPISDDLMPRGMSARELAEEARKMMGGDISDMLDI